MVREIFLHFPRRRASARSHIIARHARAAQAVGDTNHTAFRPLGILFKNGYNLRRIDIFARRHNHIVLTAGNGDEFIFIPGAEIARVTSELRREQLNIALIGMPSSGKSTLGRALAERLGKRFVDLDEEIVKADGRSIPDIFAAEGEAGFRKLEAAQTARFARENRQVISCGGGVVKDPANLRALHANGIVLFIDRPLENLLVGGGRPLSTSPEVLKTMEAQRRPLYLAAADAVIPNKTTPADAVTAAMEALDEIFSH